MNDVTITYDRGGSEIVFEVEDRRYRAGAASTRCFRDIEAQYSLEVALETVVAAIPLMPKVRGKWPDVRGPRLAKDELELLGEALLIAGGVVDATVEELCRSGNYRDNPGASFELSKVGFRVPRPRRSSTPSRARRPAGPAPEAERVVRDAEVEKQFVRWAEVRAQSEPWTMTRTEHKLVLDLKAHLEAGGQVVVSKRIPIPDGEWIVNDLFNVTRHQLIEAKNDASRAKIRMAIGQVLDYRRFVTPEAAGAVLTPEEPATDLLELLAIVGLAAIWRTSDGFADSRGGEFT